jgi:transposase
MGWTPLTASMCQGRGIRTATRGRPWRRLGLIGVDLAKHVFQVRGACADGSVAFRKKISRVKFLSFLSSQPKCIVAMEACAGAHSWGRDIAALGHEVRLNAPVYVKPFLKRQKNDMADAEAITEAAARPTMSFWP